MIGFAVVPFGPVGPYGPHLFDGPIQFQIAPGIDVGIVYVFAIGSLAVYGVILAGWASNSKYSFLGGMRSSAQLISYEIPLGMSILGMVMLARSLDLNTIVNWQTFSIGAGETTQFVQQSALSAVLNRVTTQNPSTILGALQSNGRVFLVNPSGILFAQGSRVDTAGLVASSLAMSDADFLAGRLRFAANGTAGPVLNDGTITTAGANAPVYLIGAAVGIGAAAPVRALEAGRAASRRHQPQRPRDHQPHRPHR